MQRQVGSVARGPNITVFILVLVPNGATDGAWTEVAVENI